jgi:hypothetical protein
VATDNNDDKCEPRYYIHAVATDADGRPEIVIINTARLPSASKLVIAGTPGGIVEQEQHGQEELVASTQLPIDGLLGEHRPRWEALGVQILDDGKSDDPLFCRVKLPPGWRKVATSHSLWTDLVDETGKVRAEIVYKAAFYDRYARIQLKREPDCVCADCGHEQITMDPCESCGSVRVVLISVVRAEFGENWRDAFKEEA